MKEIRLTKGLHALVDDRDYGWLSVYGWCASFSGFRSSRVYAVRRIRFKEREFLGQTQKIKMHRLIWTLHNGEIPRGLVIDHINNNGLDNRLENLQMITQVENTRRNPNWKQPKGPIGRIDF